MKNLISYLKPNFMLKRSVQTMFFIYLFWTIAFILGFQMNTNEMIPKPFGVIREAWRIVKDGSFADNFISTLFFIFKGMGYSILISLALVYTVKIDVLRGLSHFVSKLRFLTYTGIVFLFTVLMHDSSQIKSSVLVFGIVPYFVTSLLAYIDDIPEKEYQLCYTLKMNEWQTLYEVIIRGKLHLVFEVIKQNFAIAWMMICGVEVLAWSQGGLGTLLVTENRHFRMDNVFAILLVIFLTGIMFDYLFDVVSVYLFPYTDTKRYERLWIVKLTRSLGKRKDFNHEEKK